MLQFGICKLNIHGPAAGFSIPEAAPDPDLFRAFAGGHFFVARASSALSAASSSAARLAALATGMLTECRPCTSMPTCTVCQSSTA